MQKVIWILALLFVINIASASIDEYNVMLQIDDEVLTQVKIQFNKTTDLKFLLPPNSKLIEINLDGKPSDSLEFSGAKNISIIYETDYYMDDEDFLFDFIAPTEIKNLNIKLKLKPETRLEHKDSIYPRPTHATNDGESLIYEWERKNMVPDDEIAIYANVKSRINIWFPIALILILISITLISFMVPIIKKKPEKKYYLKENEEIIVNTIKNRDENKIEQGTLSIITGFPKATLSRILYELEERKIIIKQKRGKKNLVFLR